MEKLITTMVSRMGEQMVKHLMHKNQPFSLIFKAPLYLLVISIGMLTAWYAFKSYCLFPEAEKKLWHIMLKKEAAIEEFLNQQESNLHLIANNPKTAEFLKLYANNQEPTEEELKQYSTFLSTQQEKLGFKDVVLLDPSEKICFSTNKKMAPGVNLNDDAYKNSALSKSCDRSTKCLTCDFAEYAFDPLIGKPSLFITKPILDNNKFVGTLAYRYNEQPIHLITSQYNDLGNTGEIALAQSDGSFVLFIAPTRHDPDLAFKKRSLQSKMPLSIQASVLGGEGKGTAIDYRSQPVVAAWTFITKVDWGMIVKMDQSEIKKPLTTLLKLLLLLMCLLIIWIIIIEIYCNAPLFRTIARLNTIPPFMRIPKDFKQPFFISAVFCMLLTAVTITQFEHARSKSISTAKQNIADDIKKGAQDIQQILDKIVFTAQSIADDIQSNRLSYDDIIHRIKRDVAENDNIISITTAFAPYAYDPKIRLYAPSLTKVKHEYQTTMINTLYDYTDPKESALKTGWYQKAITAGQVWLNPYHNTQNIAMPPTYSYAFFDKNKQPLGVIAIAYKIKNIERIAEYSSLNRTGYSILLSENGTFLFHPILSLARHQKTLFQYAQEDGNEELTNIAQTPLSKEPQLATYHASDTQKQMWLYTYPIKTSNWVLGAIFPEEDIELKTDIIRHFYFLIVFYLILFLISMCAFFYKRKSVSLNQATIITIVILMVALISLWYIIQTTSAAHSRNTTIITDQASLDKFLEDLEEETSRKKETPPIEIPCGLLLYSLDVDRAGNLVFSGYLWNKYHTTKHKNITHSIQFPHATSLTIGNPLSSVTHNWETVTWNVRGTIYQKQNFANFPFDKQELEITLEHYDIEKNIILKPDLEAYKKISHEDTPGLDKSFTLSGFTVEQTFFSYKAINPVTNFGFAEYGKTTDHFLLIYSIITKRNLINPFLIFFLPLLGILFSIFCILMLARRDSAPFSVLAPYTGTFFALIILQRVLRDQYPTNTTLYIEFAYIFTYITITLLIIHTVLVALYPRWKFYQENIFPFIKLIFWPFQLLCWIITTLILFY